MTTVHLVRTPDAAPEAAVADADWIVYREADRWRLAAHGAPPRPAGPIDHAQLADLVLAADRAIVW